MHESRLLKIPKQLKYKPGFSLQDASEQLMFVSVGRVENMIS